MGPPAESAHARVHPGATAPLLIVSGASSFLNRDPFHNPMNSLPLFIFAAVRSGQPAPIRLGSAIAGRFRGHGLREDIAELRGQTVKPARFDR